MLNKALIQSFRFKRVLSISCESVVATYNVLHIEAYNKKFVFGELIFKEMHLKNTIYFKIYVF